MDRFCWISPPSKSHNILYIENKSCKAKVVGVHALFARALIMRARVTQINNNNIKKQTQSIPTLSTYIVQLCVVARWIGSSNRQCLNASSKGFAYYISTYIYYMDCWMPQFAAVVAKWHIMVVAVCGCSRVRGLWFHVLFLRIERVFAITQWCELAAGND